MEIGAPISAGRSHLGRALEAVLSDRDADIEWQFVVRHLYLALDMPEVPGFPASRVQQILWGELPPDPAFFQAIVLALTTKARGPQLRAGSIVVQFDRSSVSPANMLFHQPPSPMSRFLADQGRDVEAPSEPAVGDSSADTVPSSTEAMEAFARTLVSAAGGAPRLAPPDPDSCTSVEQFVDGLRLLKRWSGCTYRQLEDRSRRGKDWLPRATTADMLRRVTLPKADTLWAFTAACGLPKEEQARWETVRSRLKEQVAGHSERDLEVADPSPGAGPETAGALR